MSSAISLAIPPAATMDEWLAAGRQIAQMGKHLGFMVGDWVNAGRERFPEQIDLALEQVGIDQRFARRAAKVAAEFPPAQRDASLSFDHHLPLVALPQPERLDLLKRAHEQHWKPAQVRDAVTQHRYETGEMFQDEDIDSAMLTIIVRAWNRATPTAREQFMELAECAGTGSIDEDVPNDC